MSYSPWDHEESDTTETTETTPVNQTTDGA